MNFTTIWAHDTKGSNDGYPVIIPQTEFVDGDGSSKNPFQVGSAVQLNKVRRYLDVEFEQVADLDIRCVLIPSNTEGWEPIGVGKDQLTGKYNGNGFIIENLHIDRSTEDDVGLFSLNAGTIENVRVLGAKITGQGGVGCIAGVNENEILKSSCVGKISAKNNAGGLVGTSREATETNCYARGSVTTTDDYAGGLIGYKFKGNTSACYAAVEVKSGTGSDAGLIVYNSGTVESCFYDKDLAGSSSGAGTGFSTTEMKYDYNGENVPNVSTAPYYKWDFDDVWGHDKRGDINDKYPYLIY